MVKTYNAASVLIDILLLILTILYYICKDVYKFCMPTKEKSVTGEIVVITGTGHGIGKELAIRYASLGATVVCLSLNERRNEETINEIRKMGSSAAYAYRCDVSRREEVFEVAARVRREVGDVTILINNAGIMPCHVFLDHTADEIRSVFDVNVLAHFWMLQAFLPGMIENNYGHVVAVSSLAGLSGLPNVVPYCATKFAVRDETDINFANSPIDLTEDQSNKVLTEYLGGKAGQGLMEAISEELRISTKGKSLIKFTTVYPYIVDTGFCKKPKIRFPSLMPIVPLQLAASRIIRAQRRDYREQSVPSFWQTINTVERILPYEALDSLRNFFDFGVKPDN